MQNMKMQRIRVKGVNYGFKVGNSYIGVKTYRQKGRDIKLLSFVIDWSEDAREAVRSAILERTGIDGRHS